MPRIVIIAAGLIGAALAFRLTQAGAQVTVLEAALQPAALQPAAQASGRSFGWINASFFLNEAHHQMRVAGIAAHHRLARDLGAELWQWPGCLWWENDGQDFDKQAQALARLDYPMRGVTGAEVARMEPALVAPPRRGPPCQQE